MLRREFMAGLGGFVLAGCAATPKPSTPTPIIVPPVLIRRDRILKSIVGLRPHRDGGFRLERVPFMGKTLIHNYGHSGDGVSLSPGSSRIAAEMAHASGARETAVIGAGVMGLTTARLLTRFGHAVTIYAAQMPPHTTSNIAGALIITPDSYDRRNPNKSILDQDDRVNAISDAEWDAMADQRGYGVKRVEHYFLHGEGSALDAPPNDVLLGRRIRSHSPRVLVDPNIYLAALVRELRSAGVKFENRRFNEAHQLGNLTQKTILNCTGLGAGKLFLDEDVVPVRGQLTLLKPQSEIDYSYIARDPNSSLYMFPRDNAIVLGGTRERGKTHMNIDAHTVDRVLLSHGEMARHARWPRVIA